MTDPEKMVLIVESVEQMDPLALRGILGEIAAAGFQGNVLPRDSFLVRGPVNKDSLMSSLETLPSDLTRGFFGYSELLSFAEKYYEGEKTLEGIKQSVSRLWNKLAQGGERWSYERPLVKVSKNPLAKGEEIDTVPGPQIDEEMRRVAGSFVTRDEYYRRNFFLSIEDTLELVRQYYEPENGFTNPLYGVGRSPIEMFVHFALECTEPRQ